jgi:predicted nucleotidyltransferase
MAKREDYQKLEKFIRNFVNNLSRYIKVDEVVLFGSYARGNPREDSDVDLLFISPDFTGMGSWERLSLLGKAYTDYTFASDYFGLTPEEYKNASPLTTIGEVKETGKVVYSIEG